jgi:hypothetical protein
MSCLSRILVYWMSCLSRILVYWMSFYQGFWFIECHVYQGFWFIECHVYQGFWFIECHVYQGFWFIECHVYQGFWFIQGSVKTCFTVLIQSMFKYNFTLSYWGLWKRSGFCYSVWFYYQPLLLSFYFQFCVQIGLLNVLQSLNYIAFLVWYEFTFWVWDKRYNTTVTCV